MVFIFLMNYFIVYELVTMTFTGIFHFYFSDVFTHVDFLEVPGACLARSFILILYEFTFTIRVILHHIVIESTHSF